MEEGSVPIISELPQTYLQILGVAQDAGFPQINCQKDCCKNLWEDKSLRRMVSCIGLVNQPTKQSILFDATPDIKDQLNILQKNHPENSISVFLTHAHMGHYTGLMHFGREAMGAKEIPVYAMPRMLTMLKENAPWSQLVELKNIVLEEMGEKELFTFSHIEDKGEIQIEPLMVPHRDEFSETVGFRISGENKSALFIPDIDKWEKWDRNIIDEIEKVDYAFLDGTFYKNGEIWGRDMSLIPHPFMEESIALFKDLPKEEKAKIHFIHFNHTNPVLQKNSTAQQEVEAQGFRLAKEGQIFQL